MQFPWSKADKGQEIHLRDPTSVPFHDLAFRFPKKDFEDPTVGLAYVYYNILWRRFNQWEQFVPS